jgi:sarcosine oxidase
MTAWQATRRGLRVGGFDRFHPPHGMGSSAGHSRIIRECYFEQRYYVPIVQRAFELWAELEAESGASIYLKTGGLMLGTRSGAITSGTLASAAAFGLAAEVLESPEIRRRFPAFDPGPDVVGVYEARAGSLSPETAIAAALGRAAASGADLRFDTPVLGWTSGDSVELETAAGVVHADRVVLAAGAWMSKGLPRVKASLEVARQVLFWLEPVGGRALFRPGAFPIFIWEWSPGRSIYGFPDQGRGFKVAIHHEGPTVDPDGVNRTVRPEEADEVLEIVGRLVPAGRGPVIESAVCMYTNTPDEDFVLDRHPDDSRVLVASPCSGHGFKFSAAIGEILVDLATEGRTGFDLTPFRLDRPRLVEVS